MPNDEEINPGGGSDQPGSQLGPPPAQLPQQPLERKKSRTAQALVLILILSAVAGLSTNVFRRSMVYYKSPGEVLAANSDKPVRLSGTVEKGTIRFDASKGTVSFVVTDGKASVPVVFAGTAPDTLKDGSQAVVEGSLGKDRTFHAVKVIARCPSKFSTK